MKRKLRNIILALIKKRRKFKLYLAEKKGVKKKKFLYKDIKLTKKQIDEIDSYYLLHYGKKIDKSWHRLYQSYTGTYNKKYFPEIIFSTQLEPLLDPPDLCRGITDKSLIELIYGDIKGLYIPKTILLNCSGIFYDGKRNIVANDDIYNIVNNAKKVIIKPILDSCSGRNVRLLNIQNGKDTISNKNIKDILKEYNKNYIIQECIKNCKELSALHPDSVNTIRLITYILDGKFYHCPITLRIGVDGKNVDNSHAGGVSLGIKEDGICQKYAFKEYGEKYERHPNTNVKFENYKIPLISEMIDIAYECHKRTPHMQMISWDMTINDKYEITLIEVNAGGQSTWFPQYATGEELFGENTDKMLELLNKKRK